MSLLYLICKGLHCRDVCVIVSYQSARGLRCRYVCVSLFFINLQGACIAEMFVSLFLLICKRRALQIRLCVIVFSYSAVCLSTPLAPHHLTDVLLSTTRDQCVALNIT